MAIWITSFAKYEHLQFYPTISELQSFVMQPFYIEGRKLARADTQNSFKMFDFRRSGHILVI